MSSLHVSRALAWPVLPSFVSRTLLSILHGTVMHEPIVTGPRDQHILQHHTQQGATYPICLYLVYCRPVGCLPDVHVSNTVDPYKNRASFALGVETVLSSPGSNSVGYRDCMMFLLYSRTGCKIKSAVFVERRCINWPFQCISSVSRRLMLLLSC